MRIYTREPWLELHDLVETESEDPETRLCAALALRALYSYLLETERVGDEVPGLDERIDSVDKFDLSTPHDDT